MTRKRELPEGMSDKEFDEAIDALVQLGLVTIIDGEPIVTRRGIKIAKKIERRERKGKRHQDSDAESL